MPKKILEDIKPISRTPRKTSRTEIPVHVVQSLPREVPFEPTEPKGSSRYGIWYVAVALVVAFLFSLSFIFERASVTVTPKSETVAFDSSDTFTAQKDTTDDDTISYTEMTLDGEQSLKLPSTSSKAESVPATGNVILYNAYTTGAYKLVANTRLSTSDGKIYHIDKAVTIPGYTGSGSTLVPGSVQVSVTAAAPGADSNITNSDFTLPGLAATPQAAKIYGRTTTDGISGGISGTVYSISPDAASAAFTTLKEKLQTALIAKAQAQVPDGYVLFAGATLFSPDQAVQTPNSSDPQVPLGLHGTLTAYLIKQDTLVTAIAEKSVSQYAGEPVTIPDLSTLSIVPTAQLDPTNDTSFTFSMLGSANIVWTVNPDDIKTLFAGHKKSEFNDLLSSMPSVASANVVLKPFWKQSFPTDLTRIDVKITPPQ